MGQYQIAQKTCEPQVCSEADGEEPPHTEGFGNHSPRHTATNKYHCQQRRYEYFVLFKMQQNVLSLPNYSLSSSYLLICRITAKAKSCLLLKTEA